MATSRLATPLSLFARRALIGMNVAKVTYGRRVVLGVWGT